MEDSLGTCGMGVPAEVSQVIASTNAVEGYEASANGDGVVVHEPVPFDRLPLERLFLRLLARAKERC